MPGTAPPSPTSELNKSLQDGAEAPGPSPLGAPGRAALEGLEQRWALHWDEMGTYRFDRSAPRERVFSIDTPPPTVSGSLHVGHVFGYTQADTIARYKRMCGFSVFFPEGWDDNGLPTERRVQNYFGVRCDPTLGYQPDFVPPAEGNLHKGADLVPVSRPNFVELCERLTAEDEKVFEQTWRQLGFSYDWSLIYTTISDKARRASQRAFLRLAHRGEAYSAEAPTLWDIDFRTAVAQAELVDQERPGAYHTLSFHRPDGHDLLIDTTRPELLAACVAIVVHPEDERFRALVGTTVHTPLFGAPVPVKAHPLAQPDKGTGAAMVCTFGDITDVTWWRELALPVRAIIGRDGRLLPTAPNGLSVEGVAFYENTLAGKTVNQAQRAVVEALVGRGELKGEPRPIKHFVKYYEKGDRPLEIVTSRQWWIRTMAHKEALIDLGRQLQWHPAYMRARYEDWVNGLNSDWLISRQRFFGVPFPVWYPLDDSGEPDYSRPLLADEASLPVDPTTAVPPGYRPDQRGAPGGFMADPDVMDTWATSSLTPQIAGGWEGDDRDPGWQRTFPMDMRPQGHDIIRTWLFSTVVRAYLEHGTLPWANATLNGWILDPDRKKMSKSTGQVVTPNDLLDKYGSDGVRYWAASGRPGTDTAFDEGQMAVGRKLALKILNASKFVLGPKLWVSGPGTSPEPSAPEAAQAAQQAGAQLALVSEPVDRAFLSEVAKLVSTATSAFEDFDYARALERSESRFWDFCDNYLELVKTRAYGELGPTRAVSARSALSASLSVLLRLFAPFLPFVTEEVWSWWQPGSVHQAPWPAPEALQAIGDASPGDEDQGGSAYAVAVEVLAAVRRAKSEAKVGPRASVRRVIYTGPREQVEALRRVEDDLKAAQNVAEMVITLAGPDESASRTEVELA